jgi:hypothetical protein
MFLEIAGMTAVVNFRVRHWNFNSFFLFPLFYHHNDTISHALTLILIQSFVESAMAGPSFPDPFVHERAFGPTFLHALFATALFRCWYILVLVGAWSTAICVISANVKDLGISPALLTVSVGIIAWP